MTPEQIEIARRLVAADWWEWRVGMLDQYGRRFPWDGGRARPSMDVLPDLTDGATGGVLLGMIRSIGAYSVGAVYPDGTVPIRIMTPNNRDVTRCGATIAHAAALALLEVNP